MNRVRHCIAFASIAFVLLAVRMPQPPHPPADGPPNAAETASPSAAAAVGTATPRKLK